MSDRPFGVIVIAIFQLLDSLVTFCMGLLIVIGFANFGVPSSPSENSTLGILTLIWGAIGLLLSYGLFILKPWAWLGATILQWLSVLRSLVDASAQSENRGGAIGGLIVSLVILAFLYRPEVKRAFRQQ